MPLVEGTYWDAARKRIVTDPALCAIEVRPDCTHTSHTCPTHTLISHESIVLHAYTHKQRESGDTLLNDCSHTP